MKKLLTTMMLLTVHSSLTGATTSPGGGEKPSIDSSFLLATTETNSSRVYFTVTISSPVQVFTVCLKQDIEREGGKSVAVFGVTITNAHTAEPPTRIKRLICAHLSTDAIKQQLLVMLASNPPQQVRANMGYMAYLPELLTDAITLASGS